MLSNSLAGLFGGQEVILIVAALLLIFGGRKIPELMKGLGTGIKEFKKGVKVDDPEKKDEEKK